MSDELVPVHKLHLDQPHPYSQVDPSWKYVAPARLFGRTGAWGHLANGSWDIVVPVQVQEGEDGLVASYGAMSRRAVLIG